MAKKEIQVGWLFTGSNVVVSTGYRKEYFFPPNVSVTMDRRVNNWNDNSDKKPDQIYDILARNGSEWDFKDNGKVAEKFEVMQIERMGGKITTTVILPKSYMVEIEVEDETDAND